MLVLTIPITNASVQDLEVVEIASLLHDIQDWKYSGSEVAGANAVQVTV